MPCCAWLAPPDGSQCQLEKIGIRVVKKVGGTIDDTELVDGLVLNQTVIKSAGGPSRMEKAKIGLIQFQLSPPKPDASVPKDPACIVSSGFLMENQIVVNDYSQMDKILKEERQYLLNICKKIRNGAERTSASKVNSA